MVDDNGRRRHNCRVGCNCILALKAFLQTIRKLLYHLQIKSMYALSDCKFVFLNVTGFRYKIHTYLKQVNKFSIHIVLVQTLASLSRDSIRNFVARLFGFPPPNCRPQGNSHPRCYCC